MTGLIDLKQAEQKIGRDAAKGLKSGILKLIDQKLARRSGQASKTTVKSRLKQDRLDRLTITAPKHLYVQNFGFEGSKKNGVTMCLEAKDILTKAVEESNVLDNLADALGELRAEEVITLINFRNGQ